MWLWCVLPAFMLALIGGASAAASQVTIETAGVEEEAAAGESDAQTSSVPQLVTQGEVKVGIETDNFVELPFDRPFAMTLEFENVDLRATNPTLTYKDFSRRLDVIPTGVCETGSNDLREARFAGVTHETASGKPVSKVRFLITGVEPNRYWLFCFGSQAALTLELSGRAKADLQNELKVALWPFDSEIETTDRERLNGTIRGILNTAVQRFARSEGMTGSVRISDQLPAHDLVGSLLDLRRALQECDSDDLARTLSPAENPIPEIGDRRRAVASTSRASLQDCLSLLRFAKDRVSTVETKAAGPTAAEVETMLSRINRSLDRLEKGQSEFAAQSMQVIQQRNALILASSIGGDSTAQRYVSADTGLAYVPELDRSVPYQGINLYLRPVNPPSVTPLGSGQQGNFAQRFSFTLAFTVGDELVQEETFGGQTITFVDNWTDVGSLLVGVGYRLNPALRIGAGAIAYRQLDSLLDLESGAGTEISYYFSISLDVNVRSFFRQDAGRLFSGGTPTGEDDD